MSIRAHGGWLHRSYHSLALFTLHQQRISFGIGPEILAGTNADLWGARLLLVITHLLQREITSMLVLGKHNASFTISGILISAVLGSILRRIYRFYGRLTFVDVFLVDVELIIILDQLLLHRYSRSNCAHLCPALRIRITYKIRRILISEKLLPTTSCLFILLLPILLMILLIRRLLFLHELDLAAILYDILRLNM